MKKNKGFTLVELLAVIVILAIIMIIAIPTVLNTMETAKKKSMVNFAQKIINELSKTYVTRMTSNGFVRPADKTYYIYDIKTELGLTNTGEYYGTAAILFFKNENGEEFIDYDIELLSNDYYLNYNTYADKHENKKLDMTSITNLSEIKAMLPDGVNIKDLPEKEISVATALNAKCRLYSLAFIDGATNTTMFCKKDAISRSYFDSNNNCLLEETTTKGDIIAKYLTGQELVSCP